MPKWIRGGKGYSQVRREWEKYRSVELRDKGGRRDKGQGSSDRRARRLWRGTDIPEVGSDGGCVKTESLIRDPAAKVGGRPGVVTATTGKNFKAGFGHTAPGR